MGTEIAGRENENTKINKDIKIIDIILVLTFLGVLTWSFINPSPTVIKNNKIGQTEENFSEQSTSAKTEDFLLTNGAKADSYDMFTEEI